MSLFSSIPQARLMIYLMAAGLLPILLVAFHLISKRGEIETMNQGMEQVREMALMREKKQAVNMAVREHFKNTDHFYIDKNVESITLLNNEVESLKKIIKQSHFIENDAIKKRLEYLSKGNTLVFSEGVVQAYPYFNETAETLVHPVEVDVSDIEDILAKIEGVEIGSYAPGPNRPQLLITDFKLERKRVWEKSEVFSLNIKLLKREYF